MNRKCFLSIIFSLMSAVAFAHGDGGDDHSAPGALPFAPHGGKLGEAEHLEEKSGHKDDDKHAHDEKGGHDEVSHQHEEKTEHKDEAHEHEEEPELFFEGVFSLATSTVELYPLVIDPKNPKEFQQKKPSSGFSDVDVRVEFPRSRKFENIQVEIKSDEQKGEHWIGKIPFNKDIRFYLHVTVVESGEKKLAKIHLEKRR